MNAPKRQKLFVSFFMRALPVLLVTAALWFGATIYFHEQLGVAYRVRYHAVVASDLLDRVRYAENAVIFEDIEREDFVSGDTENLRIHRAAVEELKNLLKGLARLSPEDQRAKIQRLIQATAEYEQTFQKLVQAYREGGLRHQGLEGEWFEAGRLLSREIERHNDPRMENRRLQLRISAGDLMRNRQSPSPDLVALVKADMNRLRESLAQGGRRYEKALLALRVYETHFDEYTENQFYIGAPGQPGLRGIIADTVARIKPVLKESAARATATAQDWQKRAIWFNAVFLLLGLTGEMGMVYILARKVSRPLEQLTEAAVKVRDGHLEQKIHVRDSTAEVRVLSEVLNGMIENLVSGRKISEERMVQAQQLADQLKLTQEKLLQSQKLESVGTLAGGIAHDFNNLLAAILAYATAIKTHVEPNSKLFTDAEVIEKAAERGAELTKKLLGFARKGHYQKKIFNLNQTLREAHALLSRTVESSIAIEADLASDLWASHGDASQMLQVWMNLAVNARDAMPTGGQFLFKTENVIIDETISRRLDNLPPGRYVRAEISDTGTGMPLEVTARIFDPFFTTKEVGKGSGLGLSMVYGIVKSHHGAIFVESEVGRGTRFQIYIPALDLEKTTEIPARNVSETAAPEVDLQGRMVLIADDEDLIKELINEMLTEAGALVFCASNGEEAVAFYEKNLDVLDCVVLDAIMPKMSGFAAFERIRVLNPEARIIFLSGYAESDQISEVRERGGVQFLQKPFRRPEFLKAMKEACKPA